MSEGVSEEVREEREGGEDGRKGEWGYGRRGGRRERDREGLRAGGIRKANELGVCEYTYSLVGTVEQKRSVTVWREKVHITCASGTVEKYTCMYGNAHKMIVTETSSREQWEEEVKKLQFVM